MDKSYSLFVSCHVATAPSPKRSWLPSRTKAQQQQPQEIRVCTNRACRRQGSFQTLKTLSDIAPPNVSVKSSGCLGRCGAGPNLVVLPDGLIICHCGTAARCLEVMVSLFGGGDINCNSSLDALALRKRADVEFEKQNFAEAELLLSQAIDLKPFGGIHVTFKCRSSVRLELGNYSGALQDAKEALILAPLYSEDLATGKTIEVAKEHGGLYYLSDARIGQLSTALQSQTKSSSVVQIWLQHKHLGHPSFPLMKCLYLPR